MTYPTLPVYRGLPVPFVARREGEEPPDTGGYGFMFAFDVLTGKEYPVLVNDALFRDEDGWLWQPSTQNMDGKPQFASVSSERQRLCMDGLLCQVCGESAIHDGESSWLIPPVACERADLEVVARQPPVCVSCLAVSQEKCPHLRRNPWVHVLARETRRWGVVGDVYNIKGDIITQGEIELGMTLEMRITAAMTLARQRLLALTDWRRA